MTLAAAGSSRWRARLARVVLLAGVLTGLGTGDNPELTRGQGEDAIRVTVAPGERVFVRGELRTSNLVGPLSGDLRLSALTDRPESGMSLELRLPPGQLVPARFGGTSLFDMGPIDTVLVHDDPVALGVGLTFGVDAPLGSTDFDLILTGPPEGEAALEVEIAAFATMYNPYPSTGFCAGRDERNGRPVVRVSLEEVSRESR